jgi:hypothetical protein
MIFLGSDLEVGLVVIAALIVVTHRQSPVRLDALPDIVFARRGVGWRKVRIVNPALTGIVRQSTVDA